MLMNKKINEKKLYAGLAKVENIVYSTGFNSNVEGEGFDRSFRLTGYQEEMIERLSMAGKKMTVVLHAGNVCIKVQKILESSLIHRKSDCAYC